LLGYISEITAPIWNSDVITHISVVFHDAFFTTREDREAYFT